MSITFLLVGLLGGGVLGYFGAWTEYKFFLEREKQRRKEEYYCGYQKAIYDMSDAKQLAKDSMRRVK